MTEGSDEALVRSLMPSIRTQARRMARRFVGMTEDDFASAGNQEALICAREFDRTLGVPFEAFAQIRVRWAMYQLVKADNRQSGRRVHREVIRRRLVSAPLEYPVESLDDAFAGTRRDWRDQASAWLHEEVASIVFGMLNAQPQPYDEGTHVAKEEQSAVRAAVEDLSPEEKWFVDKHYRDDVTLDEIARELGVSYRTAKRIHQAIKASLVKSLAARGIKPQAGE